MNNTICMKPICTTILATNKEEDANKQEKQSIIGSEKG